MVLVGCNFVLYGDERSRVELMVGHFFSAAGLASYVLDGSWKGGYPKAHAELNRCTELKIQ